MAIFPAVARSLLSMNYCCGYWTTAVVIELLCGHWTDCLSWTIHTKHKKRKTELLNLYTGLFWHMATCLSLKLSAVGQICQLSLLKVIATVSQASYWMLVKTEGCSWAGYHGCKTPSYFIINFIIFFFLFYLFAYLFFGLDHNENVY